jgi:hypothetical protein
MFIHIPDNSQYQVGDQYYDKVMDDWRDFPLTDIGRIHFERSTSGRIITRRKISKNSEAQKTVRAKRPCNKARQKFCFAS